MRAEVHDEQDEEEHEAQPEEVVPDILPPMEKLHAEISFFSLLLPQVGQETDSSEALTSSSNSLPQESHLNSNMGMLFA